MQELLCYGLKLGLRNCTMSRRKAELVRDIMNKETTFLDDTTRKFYFNHDKTKNVLNFVDAPGAAIDEYKAKTLSQQHQINVMDIKTEVEAQIETSDNSLDLNRFQMNNDQLIDTQLTLQTVTNRNQELLQGLTYGSRKNFVYQQKIKYEPSHGIEAFIRSIESYADANDIKDGRKWVAIAKTALNTSEDGLLLQDSLLPAESNDWDLFKAKMLSILGNPPDYYRDFYRSFRRGSQKPGIAMSRLTQAYKRGFLTSGQELTKSDKDHIMHQFVNALDNPLRGLLKAEEKKLDFNTIADRAAELERCFGSGFAPDSAATLMFPEARVQMVESKNAVEAGNTIQLKMIELMNNMMQQSKQQHAEAMKQFQKQPTTTQYNSKPTSNRRGVNLAGIAQKLQGHCYYHVKYQNCKKQNCTFKHETTIPDDVAAACK